MRQKSGTLVLANEDQKVIWECELTGQLSDGQWENSKPHDHWEAWCYADVAVDPTNVGRDFHVLRDSYGFTRTAFLDEGFDLAGRVMSYVRVARVIGYDKPIRSVVDNVGYIGTQYGKNVDADVLAVIEEFGGKDRIEAIMEHEALYTRKQLMDDLRDISRIIKIERGHYVTPEEKAVIERRVIKPAIDVEVGDVVKTKFGTFEPVKTRAFIPLEQGVYLGFEGHTERLLPEEVVTAQ